MRGDTIHHLAVDLGANGGTVVRGEITDGALDLEAIHRFDNRPVERGGRYVWPIERLREHVEEGIRLADAAGGIETIGIETWGLDVGLLADGELIRAPVAYRDPAVTSTADAIFERVSRREIFEATGITNWATPNTLFQYHHLVTEEPGILERADRLLMMPQLLTALLGGRPAGEVTVASTTQLLDVRERAWATDLLDRLGLPIDPLPEPEPPGTTVGHLDPAIADDLSSDPDLLLPASHDTASAVAGLPLDEPAFLSTGTWFLVGVELEAPRIDDAAFAAGASNELGADGSVRFLTNLAGFFVLEECRESWRAEGRAVDYETLLAAARATEPFGPLIDADDPRFDIEGDMVAAVREYCAVTDQPGPHDRGALVRCLLESLAAKTALVLDRLLDAAGESSDRLHVGGGGVRNDLFCSMLASATDRPVVAGPVEATAVGNLLMQAVAAGEIDDLEAGRRLVAEHAEITRYEPDGDPRWAEAKARMRELVERGSG